MKRVVELVEMRYKPERALKQLSSRFDASTQRVTTQAREGIETVPTDSCFLTRLRNNSSPRGH